MQSGKANTCRRQMLSTTVGDRRERDRRGLRRRKRRGSAVKKERGYGEPLLGTRLPRDPEQSIIQSVESREVRGDQA